MTGWQIALFIFLKAKIICLFGSETHLTTILTISSIYIWQRHTLLYRLPIILDDLYLREAKNNIFYKDYRYIPYNLSVLCGKDLKKGRVYTSMTFKFLNYLFLGFFSLSLLICRLKNKCITLTRSWTKETFSDSFQVFFKTKMSELI